MSELSSWIVVVCLAVGTFLIRYSFIGLFAHRDIPPWLDNALKLMVPAIFAAIIFTGVVMVSGQTVGLTHWPRYAAAALAFIAAIQTKGHIVITVTTGMFFLHFLPWVVNLMGF